MDVSKLSQSSTYTLQTESVETPVKANQKLLQKSTLYNQAKKTSIKQGSQLLEKADIQGMVEGLNEFLEPVHTSVKFELHDKLDRYYVKVIDSATKELIREIPPEKMLDMYASMAEFMGLMIDEKI